MSQQLQELIHRSSHIAFYSGVNAENQRILKLLKDMVEQLDKLRPESYKSVADKMDFRIRVIQMVIKKIEESDETTSITTGA